MKFSQWIAILGLLAALSSCGFKHNAFQQYKEGQFQNTEITRSPYKYAFSAQVKDSQTGLPVQNFTIQPIGSPDINAVVNALGDELGLFHISRLGSGTVDLPVLISAPGFQSILQNLQIGQDCGEALCIGNFPVSVFLEPLTNGAPSVLTDLIPSQLNSDGKSTLEIFQNLKSEGKIGEGLQKALLGATNGDLLENVLVVLGDDGTDFDISQLVSSVLGQTNTGSLQGLPAGLDLGQLVPMLLTGSPETATAMLSLQGLLPYLQPIIGQISQQSNGPLANVLNSFLSDPNMSQGFASLISGLSGGTGSSLAATSFIPFVTNLLSQLSNNGDGGKAPFANLIANLLKKPDSIDLGQGSSQLASLTPFIEGLVQSLSGQQGGGIANLFNQLVSGADPLSDLQNFPADPDQLNDFAALLPYLEPLIKGLNGEQGEDLAGLIGPLLKGEDPAKALQSLLSGDGMASFVPGLESLAQQWMPRKQVLTSQLLEGLISGKFKDLRVQEDLAGGPGVLLSGRAQDIFKLLQLPNVDQAQLIQP